MALKPESLSTRRVSKIQHGAVGELRTGTHGVCEGAVVCERESVLDRERGPGE